MYLLHGISKHRLCHNVCCIVTVHNLKTNPESLIDYQAVKMTFIHATSGGLKESVMPTRSG